MANLDGNFCPELGYLSQMALQTKVLKDLQIEWVVDVEQESDARWLVKMEANKLKKICNFGLTKIFKAVGGWKCPWSLGA